MSTSPIWMLAWFLIATCDNWIILIIARWLSGFGVGMAIPSAQIYVNECCEPKIRGVLGSLPALSMSFGILFIYIFGKYLPWDYLAWICFGMSGNFFIKFKILTRLIGFIL